MNMIILSRGRTINSDLREELEMKTLTFINWYMKDAVYLNDELIYYGLELGSTNLLKALRYECISLGSLPDNLPKEYAVDDMRRWIPPKSLREFEQIQAAVKERERLEKIEYHKRALKDLE